MGARTRWTDLPVAVRAAVAARTGPVTTSRDLPHGSASDMVVELTTPTGRLFAKGVDASDSRAGMHRNEARVAAALPHGLAPALRARVEVDGWLVLVFDHQPGRHPDLRPGSPDLPLVAHTLTTAARTLHGRPLPVLPLAARWGRYVDPALLRGAALLHTDVTPRNILIDNAGRAVLVDWATPARGPAWIDTALMACRLVRAGHTVAQATEWAGSVPVWCDAHPGHAAQLLIGLARLWTDRHAVSPAAHRADLIRAAAALADHLAADGRA